MENNNLSASILKLMRAMRRHPVRPEQAFPPAVGRVLLALAKQDGSVPAELCEALDVRPSSLSELLGRMEEHALVRREGSETDRRATRIFLTDTGREAVQRMEETLRAENDRLSECFTDQELLTFCALCDRLSAHVESLPAQSGPCPHGHGRHGHGPHGHGPHGGCHHGGFHPRPEEPRFL